MAFTCLKDNQIIYSFAYSLSDWIALKEDKTASFTTSCCGSKAILKTSKLGTQFFAHKAKPIDRDCASSDETPEHMHIKYLVNKKLYECGWQVQTEKRGISSKGDQWVADIYAEKGKAKIVIEVQWSRQTFIETKRRQQVYEQSGIRCAWLLRSGSKKDRDAIVGDYLHNTKQIPVFSIYKNKNDSGSGYSVFNVNKALEDTLVPDAFVENWSLPLEFFIEKLISGKIKFVHKHVPKTYLSVSLLKEKCWKCKRTTHVISNVSFINTRYGVDYQSDSFNLKIDECDAETVKIINENFAAEYNFSPIRDRYSNTAQCSYFANSCIHCNALMGRHFIDSWAGYHFTKLTVDTRRIEIARREKTLRLFFENRRTPPNFDVGKWLLDERSD